MCKIYHIDAKLLLFVQRGDEDEYVLPVRGSEVGELFELLDVANGVFAYVFDYFSDG